MKSIFLPSTHVFVSRGRSPCFRCPLMISYTQIWVYWDFHECAWWAEGNFLMSGYLETVALVLCKSFWRNQKSKFIYFLIYSSLTTSKFSAVSSLCCSSAAHQCDSVCVSQQCSRGCCFTDVCAEWSHRRSACLGIRNGGQGGNIFCAFPCCVSVLGK